LTLLEALYVCCDHATGSRLEIDIMKRKFAKFVRKHGEQAMYNGLDYDWRFRVAAARVFCRDFSNWSGWIYRTEAAARRFWLEHGIPRWDGRPVPRLVVVGEQGVGDEILWASLLPECMIRCKEVVYACDPRLMGMLQRNLPGLVCIDRGPLETENPEGFDAYFPAADLFPMFRHRWSDFPRRAYLVPDGERVAAFDAYKSRTGIGWAGRQGRLDPLELRVADPLSLQHSESHPDIEAPPIDLKNDLDGVLALVSVLDRVVCVPSTIGHIAGAAGVKVDLVPGEVTNDNEIKNDVDWSSPPGPSPWYPNVFAHRSLADYVRVRPESLPCLVRLPQLAGDLRDARAG